MRDSEGCTSLAGAGSIVMAADALCAKAHACVADLNAADDVGMQIIILETDS